MMRAIRAALVLTALASILVPPVGGEATSCDWAWTRALPAGATPESRRHPALAYDAARGVTVLFGGRNSFYANLDDTWEWNGQSWIELPSSTSPSGRRAHAMVYDAARERVVLFGGWSASGYQNDTWEWDGITWSDADPVLRPPSRNQHAMAYDAVRGVTVLFGGYQSLDAWADTWEYDGTTWSDVSPQDGPTARYEAALSYDAARGVSVLFGGKGSEQVFDDVWEWDGARWTLITPSPGPRPRARHGHGLIYDIDRQVMVLYGGRDADKRYLEDTWIWDGLRWTEVSPAVPPSASHEFGMAYDETQGRAVLFGGKRSSTTYSETWWFGPAHEEICNGIDDDCDGAIDEGCDDEDEDGVLDHEDNCPSLSNADQSDGDGDGRGDVCDSCPGDPHDDQDEDGVCGNEDNCPESPNSGQADADGDGAGNACDPCPHDGENDADGDGICGDLDPCPYDVENDPDTDGICSGDDNCPGLSNADQADLDGDGMGDPCDPCPEDFGNDGDGDGLCGTICRRHVCSNDFAESTDSEPVHGDETLQWNELPGWETRDCMPSPDQPCVTEEDRRCFEIAMHPQLEVVLRRCEMTGWSLEAERWVYQPPINQVSPYAVGPEHFPREGQTTRYVVRACSGSICSSWAPTTATGEQDFVEFVGGSYACFGSVDGVRCEERCYAGAPKRFAQLPDC